MNIEEVQRRLTRGIMALRIIWKAWMLENLHVGLGLGPGCDSTATPTTQASDRAPKSVFRRADLVLTWGRQNIMSYATIAERPWTPRSRKTLRMRGTLCTETGRPGNSPAARRGRSRRHCRTADMGTFFRESDGLIVPEKRANKARPRGGGGVRGGKGADQGKRRASLTRCGHSAAESVASTCVAYERPTADS